MISALAAGAILLALALHLYQLAVRSRARARKATADNDAAIAAVIPDARDVSTGTAGVTTFAGTWGGQRVQVRTIVDTLATRKLPTLWLSVTVTEPVSVPAKIDLMMRPGSATTFSNFDHLPYTLPTPTGFPDGAIIRSDRNLAWLPLRAIADCPSLFDGGRVKELLVTPNGVRIVWLLDEADRARYGVFRQAVFADAGLDPALVEDLLGRASSLRAALNAAAAQAA